jgi:hypothetical protein
MAEVVSKVPSKVRTRANMVFVRINFHLRVPKANHLVHLCLGTIPDSHSVQDIHLVT